MESQKLAFETYFQDPRPTPVTPSDERNRPCLIRVAELPDEDAAAAGGDARPVDQGPTRRSIDTAASRAWYRVRSPFVVSLFFVLAFLGVYHASYWLRFEGELGPAEARSFVLTAGWIVAAKLAVFLGFRLHCGWGRLVSFYDLVALVKATSASLLAVLLAERFQRVGIEIVSPEVGFLGKIIIERQEL